MNVDILFVSTLVVYGTLIIASHYAPVIALLNKSIPQEKKKRGIQKLIDKLTKLFEKNNLNYFVDYGTLLGIYRKGDIIPWDNDCDIGIYVKSGKEIDRILKLLKSFCSFPEMYNYKLICWHTYILRNKCLVIDTNNKTHCNITFYFDSRKNDKKIHTIFSTQKQNFKYNRHVSKKIVFPLKKVTMDNKYKTVVNVPNNTEKFLKIHYGEFLGPDRTYDEKTKTWKKLKPTILNSSEVYIK